MRKFSRWKTDTATVFKEQTMNKEDIYDILAAVAVGLMLAFFLTIRG
jgi:hypothetical protein